MRYKGYSVEVRPDTVRWSILITAPDGRTIRSEALVPMEVNALDKATDLINEDIHDQEYKHLTADDND